jgi:uncharacterized protein (DUF488 family)
MFTREKIVLKLLNQLPQPVSKTIFVKLVFLLRHETSLRDLSSFYDFVPYKYGPFSFTLYRELERLKSNGYVREIEGKLASLPLVASAGPLAPLGKAAVYHIVGIYGNAGLEAILKDVYRRYPWFALNSELPERTFASIESPLSAPPAVYTSGYEGMSVEAFFNRLLKQGIRLLIDVRANPVSRKYGFAGSRLRQFCERLGLSYRHEPSVGIPGGARSELNDLASYRRLFRHYEESILPAQFKKIAELGGIMSEIPSVLVCFEKDIERCHRGCLAPYIARESRLKVIHL